MESGTIGPYVRIRTTTTKNIKYLFTHHCGYYTEYIGAIHSLVIILFCNIFTYSEKHQGDVVL